MAANVLTYSYHIYSNITFIKFILSLTVLLLYVISFFSQVFLLLLGITMCDIRQVNILSLQNKKNERNYIIIKAQGENGRKKQLHNILENFIFSLK